MERAYLSTSAGEGKPSAAFVDPIWSNSLRASSRSNLSLFSIEEGTPFICSDIFDSSSALVTIFKSMGEHDLLIIVAFESLSLTFP